MAEKKDTKKPKTEKKVTPSKKSQTVRERAAAASASGEKPKRIRKAASRAKLPLSKAKSAGKKEYHLPLPDNKAGKVLKKPVRFVPKFVREAFQEIKLVTWPDRKMTIRLTTAVFIFAVVFASIVGALDYVLGEIFKRLFVNNS